MKSADSTVHRTMYRCDYVNTSMASLDVKCSYPKIYMENYIPSIDTKRAEKGKAKCSCRIITAKTKPLIYMYMC